MNEFSIEKQIQKNTGEKTLIYRVGKYVEVTGKDGFKARGTIVKINDDKLFIKNNICELEIKMSNLLDIISKNPY